CTQALEFPWTF
nr:immunoglobulin light chain junction region [Macaca mulatta]MOW43923.1 immunoglobulin light chain junction region [Macaca mulatta]MOX27335.1 immunoglobulin light chain junction region [Macaca mulatta]